MPSESVCQVERSWVDVGSFHTRFSGEVYELHSVGPEYFGFNRVCVCIYIYIYTVHIYSIYITRCRWSLGQSTFDSQFLMDGVGYLIVTMGVNTLSYCTRCTGCVLNDFLTTTVIIIIIIIIIIFNRSLFVAFWY
jgi:hypothetical protein